MANYVYEVEFELEYQDAFAVSYNPDSPKARVVDVTSRVERDAAGKPLGTVGVLLVRDAPGPGSVKQVLVCRRQGRITNLHPWCGPFIRSFTSRGGDDEWYVFESVPTEYQAAPRAKQRPVELPPPDPSPRTAVAMPAPPWPEGPLPLPTPSEGRNDEEAGWLTGFL